MPENQRKNQRESRIKNDSYTRKKRTGQANGEMLFWYCPLSYVSPLKSVNIFPSESKPGGFLPPGRNWNYEKTIKKWGNSVFELTRML